MSYKQIYKIGDAFKLINDIPNKTIDLILTDIPYGVVNRDSGGLRKLDKDFADDTTYFNMDLALRQINRVCRGSIYIFCGTEQVSEIRNYRFYLFLYRPIMQFQNLKMDLEQYLLRQVRMKSPVWRYPTEHDQKHPTQKPLELFKYLIL